MGVDALGWESHHPHGVEEDGVTEEWCLDCDQPWPCPPARAYQAGRRRGLLELAAYLESWPTLTNHPDRGRDRLHAMATLCRSYVQSNRVTPVDEPDAAPPMTVGDVTVTAALLVEPGMHILLTVSPDVDADTLQGAFRLLADRYPDVKWTVVQGQAAAVAPATSQGGDGRETATGQADAGASPTG